MYVRVVLQRFIAGRAPRRHDQHAAIALRELDAEPLPECARLRTQVDQHVEYGPTNTAHDLRFGMRRDLVVQTAHRSGATVHADVRLQRREIDAVRRELVDAPCTKE